MNDGNLLVSAVIALAAYGAYDLLRRISAFLHDRRHGPLAEIFDHVKFGVTDYAASRAFYLAALAPLGVKVIDEREPSYGIEMSAGGVSSLCLFQTAEKPALLHIAFVADSREKVEEFHRAALATGGKDNGPPGLRPQYSATYYAAFVIDPDGHNIEAVCHHA